MIRIHALINLYVHGSANMKKSLKRFDEGGDTDAVSYIPTRGMRTRTDEEKEKGAKVLKEGLPFVTPMGGASSTATAIATGIKRSKTLGDLALRGSQSLAEGYGGATLNDQVVPRVKKAIAEDIEERKKYNAAMEKVEESRRQSKIDIEQLKDRIKTKADYNQAGYKKGGKVSSTSSRADGIAQRGKTKGKMR